MGINLYCSEMNKDFRITKRGKVNLNNHNINKLTFGWTNSKN